MNESLKDRRHTCLSMNNTKLINISKQSPRTAMKDINFERYEMGKLSNVSFKTDENHFELRGINNTNNMII